MQFISSLSRRSKIAMTMWRKYGESEGKIYSALGYQFHVEKIVCLQLLLKGFSSRSDLNKAH